ncbi:MAG: DUF523 and DUF1722 domain-containing protein [Kiritimatiellae bacterium]|nr:DUF523 and DUF1722 domain-containing protein [Kiritimatiellia bacterium]MDD5521108.1 DUF523 and DUF1722 domain-containing protein [Kiritimatiellia bacterium]
MDKIKLGISKCLLGERVRYDGQHKLDKFLTDTLGKYVEYVAVCPEVECGLSVPREPMILVGSPDSPMLITIETMRDLTGQVLTWAVKKLDELGKKDLCGFIFKSKSPNCGMAGVKVYDDKGLLCGLASGIFAREFMRRFPLLPVEDEERLHDHELRENFFERIFTLARYRKVVACTKSVSALMQFHARHKLLLMAHSEKHCRDMGKLLAKSKGVGSDKVYWKYEVMLMEGLRYMTTVRKNVNVLHHMLGYFRKLMGVDEKREIRTDIDRFAKGDVPLIVPLALFRHYVRKYKVDYLADQYYLNPHPLEVAPKNHV